MYGQKSNVSLTGETRSLNMSQVTCNLPGRNWFIILNSLSCKPMQK